MANISRSTHQSIDMKLAQAAQHIRAAQTTTPDVHMNFERALRVIDECRTAIAGTENIDAVVTHLRAASRAPEHFCSGPAKACVAAVIKLIDAPIGGATF